MCKTLIVTIFFAVSLLTWTSFVGADTFDERLQYLENTAHKLQSDINQLKKDMQFEKNRSDPRDFIPKSTNMNKATQKQAQYENGFDMHIYALNSDTVIESETIPSAHLGSFRADRSEFNMEIISKKIKYDISSINTMWQGIGYLNITEPGQYTLTLDTHSDTYSEVYIGDKLISNKHARSGNRNTLVATCNLDIGLFKVDFRMYTGVKKNMRISDIVQSYHRLKIDVKTPATFQPQPAHNVLALEM